MWSDNSLQPSGLAGPHGICFAAEVALCEDSRYSADAAQRLNSDVALYDLGVVTEQRRFC